MAYWWDPAEPDHYVGDPSAWWPGEEYADFVGLDWYGTDPEPMTASPSFSHWYAEMAPSGLPLVIAEYGQGVIGPEEQLTGELDRGRAEAIDRDATWIAEHPQVIAWLYWHGPGHGGDWRLTGDAARSVWRDVATGAYCP
jgi:hypothetical protein